MQRRRSYLALGILTFVAMVAIATAILLWPKTDLTSAGAGPSLLGDASCNGVVNSIDAALILQFGAGLIASLPCMDAADVNEDGSINAIDAALILQFEAALLCCLPPAPPLPPPQATPNGGTISIGSATVATGEEGSVLLEALSMPSPGLGAWTIDISYSSSAVSVVNCSPQQGGVCNPNFVAGSTVRVTGARATGLVGDTKLASITFRCDAEGSSVLALSIQVLADATIGDPQDIDAVTQNGSIICGPLEPTATPTHTPTSVIEVPIDIKPGSDPNVINPTSQDGIPVGILSTVDFDARTQIALASLTFGRTGDEDSLLFCTPGPEDVNGDGLMDEVCKFDAKQTGFQCHDTWGILRGYTKDGVPIEGRDSVRISPSACPAPTSTPPPLETPTPSATGTPTPRPCPPEGCPTPTITPTPTNTPVTTDTPMPPPTPAPPPNDDFANAVMIPEPIPYSNKQDTTFATAQPQEPIPPPGQGCSTLMDTTVWYRYTSSSNQTLIADTFGSNYDTQIVVWSGTDIKNLTFVGCNDDFFTLQSQVSFAASAGTTYYFQLDGWGGTTGNLVLNLTAAATPTPTPTATPCYIICPTPTATPTPSAGLDWSMGIDVDGGTTDDCDSTAGPTKCTLDEGQTFTLNFYLNSLPVGVAGYQGYDGSITYTGVTSKENLVNVWPNCVFSAGGEGPGELFPACAIGIGAQPSTYTGLMATFDFNCAASGTITMIHGEFHTSLSEDGATQHFEGEGTTETLTINCVEPSAPFADTDGDGCTDVSENGPDETLGGRRDWLNEWDYFNPTNDGRNRIDDILLVLGEYRNDDPPNTDYVDRTYVGPNAWNLGPPNGVIRINDVLNIIAQYRHDCG